VYCCEAERSQQQHRWLNQPGVCESCLQPAPFHGKKGPYLEVHHVHRLSDGGPDHPGALEQRSPAGGAGSQNDTAGALGYPLVQFSPDLEG